MSLQEKQTTKLQLIVVGLFILMVIGQRVDAYLNSGNYITMTMTILFLVAVVTSIIYRKSE